MKIIVSVKQVPSRDSALRPNAQSRWIETGDLTWEMNEPDAYALEEALQLRERVGGEVIVLTLGSERAGQTIREALAKGADRAIHVQVQEGAPQDALATAKLLAAAVEAESADLILAGLQSDDLGYGQTGVILAELLGYAHATIVMEVEPQDGAVRVKRELEDGWFQHVTLPTPAVLTIQSGIRKLRYATLMGIKKAKSKEVRSVAASDLKVAAASESAFSGISAPERAKQAQMLTGEAGEVARQLVEKLRFEARVL